jgi:hypothetical protein
VIYSLVDLISGRRIQRFDTSGPVGKNSDMSVLHLESFLHIDVFSIFRVTAFQEVSFQVLYALLVSAVGCVCSFLLRDET